MNFSGAVLGGTNSAQITQLNRDFGVAADEIVLTDSDTTSVFGSGGDTAWLGRAQFGLQYACPLPRWGGARFTARGLFEIQSWDIEGIEFFLPNTPQPVDLDIQQDLYGFSFGVGLER